VVAYVTGVVLIALIFVAMPLKYLAEKPEASAVIGPLHGFLYAVYVLVVLVLGYARRWSIGRILLVLIAGTVPFAAFFVEHRVVADERARDREVTGDDSADRRGQDSVGARD